MEQYDNDRGYTGECVCGLNDSRSGNSDNKVLWQECQRQLIQGQDNAETLSAE